MSALFCSFLDINECLTSHGGCDTDALCLNTLGSRQCACNRGYSGNGLTCMGKLTASSLVFLYFVRSRQKVSCPDLHGLLQQMIAGVDKTR